MAMMGVVVDDLVVVTVVVVSMIVYSPSIVDTSV